jgi:predicted  nucleic acid-binding Zn ribbon protein
LDVYDKLNYEHNFNNLVPIYRIRRTIGERVNRTEFNDWLLEMQADDIFQLQGGSVEDSAPDKIEDSVSTELDGLRCYARLLKA